MLLLAFLKYSFGLFLEGKTMPRKATKAKSRKAKTTTRRAVKKAPARKVAAKKRTAARKVVAKKKTTARKVTAKKVNAVKAKSLKTVTKKPMTKSEIMATIADLTGHSKKEVGSVIQALHDIIAAHTKKGAVGNFTLPGLLKINVVQKPAKKARKGINPFTGEEMMFKAKPAHKVVKVKPLKTLKEIVQ